VTLWGERLGPQSPSSTMWPGLRPTSIPSGILIHLFGHNRHRPTIGELCPLFDRGVGSTSNTMWPGLRPTSAILIPIQPFGHNTWTENWGGLLCPLFGEGELGTHLTQCCLGEAYFCTKWYLDPSSHLATTDMGPNWGGGTVPLLVQGSWVPI